jgi:NDP-sugar pyrophosphorylase family protein
MIPMVILAGGLATRLGELTVSTPKSLIPVSGRKFIDWQIELIENAGIQEIYFLISHLSDQIIDHLKTRQNDRVKFHYMFDGPEPAGTGGALLNNFNSLPEEFFLMYGDSYLDLDYVNMHKYFLQMKTDYLMSICETPQNDIAQSNVEYKDGIVMSYSKIKPSMEMKHEDFGVSILHRKVLSEFAGQQRCDLSVITSQLASEGKVMAFLVSDNYYEVGSTQGIQELERHLEAR